MLMNSQGVLEKTNCSTALRGGFFALLVACMVESSAVAAPIHVQARQNQSIESYFTLDFGQGGVASALISRTDMQLEIDGLTGSARIMGYDQDIDPLSIPGPTGPVSTGAIKVRIVPGSSTGTYNRATGEFVTDELYHIEFDDTELAIFGLTSPVILPSQSVGIVDIENSTVGRVTMNWAGTNVSNETIPLNFSYACTIFATFSVAAASYVQIEMVPLVSSTIMTETLRTTLLKDLNFAIELLNAGDVPSAVRILQKFIAHVNNRVPASITPDNALPLTNAASIAIDLTRVRPIGVLRMPASRLLKGDTGIGE